MINTNIRHIVLCLLMLVPCVLEAQTDRDFIRQGNKAYRQKNFPQAEVQYRKALSKNNGNPQDPGWKSKNFMSDDDEFEFEFLNWDGDEEQ